MTPESLRTHCLKCERRIAGERYPLTYRDDDQIAGYQCQLCYDGNDPTPATFLEEAST